MGRGRTGLQSEKWISGMRHVKRKCLLTLLLPPLTAFPSVGQAQHPSCADFGLSSIEWIVPFSAGGGYDTYSRLLEPYFERETGAEIVVVNKPGAGGLIGAKSIQSAPPSGETMGIIPVGSLIARGMLGDDAPDPLSDFHIVGQISPSPYVWVVGTNSAIKDFDDLVAASDERPILFGATGGDSLVSATLGSHALQIEHELVSGYKGSTETKLAAVRGEIDGTSLPLDAVREMILAHELRPVLQLTVAPTDEAALAGIPTFGGEDGTAAALAKARGDNPDEARAFADAAVGLSTLSRVIVAQEAIEGDTAACLEDAFAAAASDPQFAADAAAAGRAAVLVAREEVEARIRATTVYADEFRPILEAQMAKLRQ
jgi:tripartite-type tricarboxylate transporter receptor subunit TctC